MEPTSAIGKWVGHNWPIAATCAVLLVGVGVLWFRSSEYDSPSSAEAAVVESDSVVMVPGKVTVITPGENAAPTLVANGGAK